MKFYYQEWVLQSTNGQPIVLTFETFDIKGDNPCDSADEYDHIVEVNDGSSTQLHCGTSIPEPVTSTAGIITVKFRSDQFGTRSGFLASACCFVSVTTDVTSEWKKDRKSLQVRQTSSSL